MRQVLDVARAWWWNPILAGCAVLLGKAGLVTRAYAIVFGNDWYVVTNGEFSHLRMVPRR